MFALAKAYAIENRVEDSEKLIAAHFAATTDPIDQLMYGDGWLNLGLLTACQLKQETACVSRWQQLLDWPLRDAIASDRLSTVMPMVMSWPRGTEAVNRASTANLIQSGNVLAVRVHRSVPARVFDHVAVNAIRKWVYEPKWVNGTPVAHSGRQTMTFQIARR